MIYWRSMPEGLKRKEQTVFAQKLLADAVKIEYQRCMLPKLGRTVSGKPYFINNPDIQFNYSHCKKAVVCTVSGAAVGIDIETIRPFQARTAEHFCSEREWNWIKKQTDQDLAWIQIWTMKEAYVKYTGTGIRTDLRCLDTLDAMESKEAQKEFWDHGKKAVLYAESFSYMAEVIAVIGEQKINTTICCV